MSAPNATTPAPLTVGRVFSALDEHGREQLVFELRLRDPGAPELGFAAAVPLEVGAALVAEALGGRWRVGNIPVAKLLEAYKELEALRAAPPPPPQQPAPLFPAGPLEVRIVGEPQVARVEIVKEPPRPPVSLQVQRDVTGKIAGVVSKKGAA